MKYESLEIETAPRRLALRIVREISRRNRRDSRRNRIAAKRAFLNV